MTTHKHVDRFSSYADLSSAFNQGRDYRVSAKQGVDSHFLIAAIHGGSIEPFMSEISRSIAENRYGLYLFEGLDVENPFYNLHIASHKFDEPGFNEIASQHGYVITIHGCRDKWGTGLLLGGLNEPLKDTLQKALQTSGIEAHTEGHIFKANTMQNVCNRGKLGPEVQIEIPYTLKNDEEHRFRIAHVVQSAINHHKHH